MKKKIDGGTKVTIVVGLILAAYYFTGAQNYKEPQKIYSYNGASFEVTDKSVGCDSKYSDDKKRDIFNSDYKDHWMTWKGEVVLASADDVSLNIDGKGTQDLSVDFENKNAGYNLTKGNFITVKFLMKQNGGCFLPFSGNRAVIQ